MFVALTEADQRYAERVGRGRYEANQINTAMGAHNKQLDWGRETVDLLIDGSTGELAFCRKYDLPFDDSVGVGRGWARRPDTVDRQGNRYDIKATPKPRGRLMLYKPKPGENDYSNIDIFVLTRLHRFPPAVEVVGWAYKANLMRDENLEDWGYGPTYFLNEHDPRFHHFLP